MRDRATTSDIPVSCGHRVPRVPVPAERGNVYWCAACGEHRRSGGKSTGERGFDFLLELRDTASSMGLVVDDPGTEQGRAVVRALGASIRS